ncbi:MAG: hypothetical protein P8R42_20850 [Candidatus Binatia bacterium]|nr:hypothetical protein [Candidatus Binatia bacterium]
MGGAYVVLAEEKLKITAESTIDGSIAANKDGGAVKVSRDVQVNGSDSITVNVEG